MRSRSSSSREWGVCPIAGLGPVHLRRLALQPGEKVGGWFGGAASGFLRTADPDADAVIGPVGSGAGFAPGLISVSTASLFLFLFHFFHFLLAQGLFRCLGSCSVCKRCRLCKFSCHDHPIGCQTKSGLRRKSGVPSVYRITVA